MPKQNDMRGEGAEVETEMATQAPSFSPSLSYGME